MATTRREREREKGFPTYVHYIKTFSSPARARPRPAASVLPSMAGAEGGRADIKAGELGTIAAVALLVGAPIGDCSRATEKGKKQKVSLRNQ